jgi:hypothetical protein
MTKSPIYSAKPTAMPSPSTTFGGTRGLLYHLHLRLRAKPRIIARVPRRVRLRS